MKWLKKDIQNILKNRYLAKIINAIIYFVWVMFLFSIISYYSGIMYDLSQYPFAKTELTLQLNTFSLFLVIFMLSLFVPKKIMIIVWLVALFKLQSIFYNLPEMNKISFINSCIDMRYCKEGLEKNVNKSNCHKEKGAWNNKKTACMYQFEIKDCYKLKGDWEYPDICK